MAPEKTAVCSKQKRSRQEIWGSRQPMATVDQPFSKFPGPGHFRGAICRDKRGRHSWRTKRSTDLLLWQDFGHDPARPAGPPFRSTPIRPGRTGSTATRGDKTAPDATWLSAMWVPILPHFAPRRWEIRRVRRRLHFLPLPTCLLE